MQSSPLYRADERPAKVNLFTRRRLPLLIIGIAALILIGTVLGSDFTQYNSSNAVTWYSTSNQQTDNALIKSVTVNQVQANDNQDLPATNLNSGAVQPSNSNPANANNAVSNSAANTDINAAGAVINAGAKR